VVAQQTNNAGLGKALLPVPHRRPADAYVVGHPLRRVSTRRDEHDARSLDVPAPSVAVGRQPLALCSIEYYKH
jgi:hypothetical protein